MVRVTPQRVYAALKLAGATDAQADTLTAISGGETGGTFDTSSRLNNPPIEDSRGLFQINLIAHPDVTVACAEDVNCSAAAAMRIAANGYTPWSAYTNGAYKKYLGYGTAPGQSVGGTTGPPVGDGGTDAPIPGASVGKGGQAVPDQTLESGLRDTIMYGVALALALTFVAVGAYGTATGQTTYGGTVRKALGQTTRTAKTVAKVAAIA